MKIKNSTPPNITKFKGVDKLVAKTVNKEASEDLKHLNNHFDFYEKYNNLSVNKYLNMDKIKELKITNLRPVLNKGVRGESLSAVRNQKYLPLVKDYGINTIIDLRTADYTEKFAQKCKNLGLEFFHIPIDSKTVSDREIINSMPVLFDRLEKGNFYIACAQGKHRTDIALAINYLFNPKHGEKPPKMYGHVEKGKMRCQDIYTRANSIYKSMTPEDKKTLGWTKQFDEEFKLRKQRLLEFNEE